MCSVHARRRVRETVVTSAAARGTVRSMKHRAFGGLCGAWGFSLFFGLMSSRAAADFGAAAFVGVGLLGQPGDDLMGFGYGARGGYTWESSVYLGLVASMQHGTKDPEPGVTNNSMKYGGAEVGYQFEVGRVGVRPALLGGVAYVDTSRASNGAFVSPCFGLSVAPYAVVLRSQDTDVLVGLDVRYVQSLWPVEQPDNASPAFGVPLYVFVGATFH